MQLEATLGSFFRHVVVADAAQMTVLYCASSSKHKSQYLELEREFRAQVGFVQETSFRRQVLELLRTSPSALAPGPRHTLSETLLSRISVQEKPVTRPTSFVIFLVDDNLFVRSFDLDAAIRALDLNSDALGFSLRLGRNTTHCYVLDREQSLPRFESLPESVLKWRWSRADGDFGYPLEVSSSIYPLETVIGLLKRTEFSDPNTLESQMFRQERRFVRQFPVLLCYEKSVVFSVPLNRVQQVYGNRAADMNESSSEALAELFDQGQRIRLAALEGFVPSACHQEVGLQFEQRTR